MKSGADDCSRNKSHCAWNFTTSTLTCADCVEDSHCNHISLIAGCEQGRCVSTQRRSVQILIPCLGGLAIVLFGGFLIIREVRRTQKNKRYQRLVNATETELIE